MAYDEGLAQRIKTCWTSCKHLNWSQKRCSAASGLWCRATWPVAYTMRIGPERHAWGIKMPHTLPFDITGRVNKGWVMVVAEGCESDKDLYEWVEQGVDFALSLPPK